MAPFGRVSPALMPTVPRLPLAAMVELAPWVIPAAVPPRVARSTLASPDSELARRSPLAVMAPVEVTFRSARPALPVALAAALAPASTASVPPRALRLTWASALAPLADAARLPLTSRARLAPAFRVAPFRPARLASPVRARSPFRALMLAVATAPVETALKSWTVPDVPFTMMPAAPLLARARRSPCRSKAPLLALPAVRLMLPLWAPLALMTLSAPCASTEPAATVLATTLAWPLPTAVAPKSPSRVMPVAALRLTLALPRLPLAVAAADASASRSMAPLAFSDTRALPDAAFALAVTLPKASRLPLEIAMAVAVLAPLTASAPSCRSPLALPRWAVAPALAPVLTLVTVARMAPASSAPAAFTARAALL